MNCGSPLHSRTTSQPLSLPCPSRTPPPPATPIRPDRGEHDVRRRRPGRHRGAAAGARQPPAVQHTEECGGQCGHAGGRVWHGIRVSVGYGMGTAGVTGVAVGNPFGLHRQKEEDVMQVDDGRWFRTQRGRLRLTSFGDCNSHMGPTALQPRQPPLRGAACTRVYTHAHSHAHARTRTRSAVWAGFFFLPHTWERSGDSFHFSPT